MANEFEKSIGWNGPPLKDVVGRDITVREQGELRRGPIHKTHVTVDGKRKYSFIQFRVGWVALKEGEEWNLESEPSNPEEGTFAFGMNPDSISSRMNPLTDEIICGKAIIHRDGDNIPKPETPTEKPANYIYGE